MAEENPSVPRPSTLKLKPLKPGLHPSGGSVGGLKLPPKPGAAPAAPAPAASATPDLPPATPASEAKSTTSSLEQLKSLTQNLKSATAPIPQQAILHKTGIIADPGLTEAQLAAAKARTSRISLSDAMGVAPVKNEPVPMKTIRIKRPVDLGGESAAAPAAPTEGGETTNVTQRKTLKITRPGSARPSGKFGLKKPNTQAATVAQAPEGAAADGEVADIPEMPAESVARPLPVAGAETVPDVPKGVAVMGLIVQIAACLAMGFLAYKLYVDTTISPF